MPQAPESDSGRRKSEFEEAGQEKPLSLLREFLLFVREDKKWWLVPILLVLSVLGLLVVLGSTGAAPLIYTVF